MAKQLKQSTKNTSTVTNKAVTEQTKKGGITMNLQQAIQQLMMDYNNYQEYRKNNKQAYNFASKQQMIDFTKKLSKEEQEYLIKSYLIQRKIQTKLAKYILNEYLLNNAYGKEDIHPSEQQPDESTHTKQEQRLQQEFNSTIKATKKTKRAVNKAALDTYEVQVKDNEDQWTLYESFKSLEQAKALAKQLEQDAFEVRIKKGDE